MEFEVLQQTLEGEISKLVQTEIPKLVQTHLQPLKVKMEHAHAHYEAVLALLRSTPEYQKLVIENKALRAELDLKNSLNISVEGCGHVNLDHVNLDHVNSDHVNSDHVNLDITKQIKLEPDSAISISRLVLKVEEKVQIPNNDLPEDDLQEDELSYVTTELDDEFGSDAEDACAVDEVADVVDEVADAVDEVADVVDEVADAVDEVADAVDEVADAVDAVEKVACAHDEVEVEDAVVDAVVDAAVDEEDDEEVFLFEHPTHGSFYTSSLTHGVIYEVACDNEVGEQVGQFIDGVAVFLS